MTYPGHYLSYRHAASRCYDELYYMTYGSNLDKTYYDRS